MSEGTLKLNDTDTPVGIGAPPGVPSGGERPPQESFDFWRFTQKSLRGRYREAGLLALAGCATGALIGERFGQRLYAATGLVRVASVLPTVLRETDQNRPMANFDGFIQAQREVMASRETIQAAMKDEVWRKEMLPSRIPTEAQFVAALKVDTRPRSDNLRVTFTHADPTVAATGVKSIVSAFQLAFQREQDRVEGQRTEQLATRRDNLSAEIGKLDQEIRGVADGHTSAELEPLYLAAAERVKKLRGALADVQCTLAGGPDLTPRSGSGSQLPAEIVAAEILRSAMADQARIESRLLDARSAGCGPNHPMVLRLEAAAAELQKKIAKAIEICNAARAMRDPGESPVSLSERETNLKNSVQTAEEEMKRLAKQRTQLAALEERTATLAQNLRETETRLDALATEASLGGRLTVISSGDKPITAAIDSRLKTATLGGMAGMVLPVAGLVIYTSIRRRYRFCEEVAEDFMDRVPFVAVLPDLAHDPDMGAVAAHAVHSLRVRLQPPKVGEPRTYLLTPASAHEGKSSVSLALGLSFAAAGFRTLLVDCDPGVRRLTRAFDADQSPGLIEAIGGQEPNIGRVPAGLSILTAGRRGAIQACRFAPLSTMRLLASLRDRFDIVLIDGDPVLTGIATSVLAPQVDGVIVTLAREQERSRLVNSIRHLGMLGANLAAGVFSNALAGEFRDSIKDVGRSPSGPLNVLPASLNRFGPLVSATMTSLSLTREEDLTLIPSGVALSRPEHDQRKVA